MMKSDELKPVPCGCGGEAILKHYCYSYGDDDQYYFVWCERCDIQTKTYPTEAEAITAWNRAMSGSDYKSKSVERTAKAKGRWQRRKGSDCWECSECHAVLENDDLGMHNFYFCYHCGANMMDKSGYMDIEEVHYE